MKKILVNFAHPAKTKSKINMALRKAIEGLEGVSINDLYDNYPDFMIDVKREQALCESHDVIVFQHPFYWYQPPAIVKEWYDLVLEHGWAYGSKGNTLRDKIFVQALTAGGGEESYKPEGMNKFTLSELTLPYRATANLCKMQWISPFAVLGIHRGLPEDEVRIHAENYRRFIVALREDGIDIDLAQNVEYCSSNLDAIMRKI